jgi:hypothetical protein
VLFSQAVNTTAGGVQYAALKPFGKLLGLSDQILTLLYGLPAAADEDQYVVSVYATQPT